LNAKFNSQSLFLLFSCNLKLGNSAIHCAAQYGQLDVVQALLENGADVNSMGVSDYLRVKSIEIDWIESILLFQLLRSNNCLICVQHDIVAMLTYCLNVLANGDCLLLCRLL
jgi:ankyrin repeat protein